MGFEQRGVGAAYGTGDERVVRARTDADPRHAGGRGARCTLPVIPPHASVDSSEPSEQSGSPPSHFNLDLKHWRPVAQASSLGLGHWNGAGGAVVMLGVGGAPFPGCGVPPEVVGRPVSPLVALLVLPAFGFIHAVERGVI